MTAINKKAFGSSTLDEVQREQERLENVARYDILDTPREEAFDRITRLARKVFNVPIALVNIVDGHRTWHKSCYGFEGDEEPREHAFCNHTIRENTPMVIPDATLDRRFADNPYVVADPGVRFYAGVPLQSRDGHNIGSLCIVDTQPHVFAAEQVSLLADLGKLVMDELELRQLATTDSLTGVMSRRAFSEAAARAVALALRHNHELSLIVFDIDHFKAINDSQGHPAGDEVLARTLEVCMKKLRQTDYVGRLGGEEFAVLLPSTGRAYSLEVAEKLRTAIERQKFVFGHKTTPVTASFGVVSLGLAVRDVDSLLARADEALYSAKQSGRNRCVAWQDASDKTASPRRKVLKAGQIYFNGRTSVINCTVRSLSDDGAGLDVFSSADIPKKFDLVIRADDFSKSCRVTQQTDKHLEVEFC